VTRRNNKAPNHADSQPVSDDDEVEDPDDPARHSPTVFSENAEYSNSNDEDGGCLQSRAGQYSRASSFPHKRCCGAELSG
jgi:hypothetical protein